MENSDYISFLARIEAIKVEVEGAKLHNELMKHDLARELYSPTWFIDKAHELQSIAAECYR